MTSREDYFIEIYHQNKDKIYRLCLGFLGNIPDADDLNQEILIKIWSKLDSFKGKSTVATWVYRVATNTALLYVKRKNRKDQKFTALFSDKIAIPINNNSKEREEKINKLYQAIATLKEIDRIVISLLLEKNSYEEIALITGLNISNIGVKINRIKKILNTKLS